MTPPAIALAGISKDYRGLRPLRIESLTLAPGEHAAILGLDQPMAETLVNLVTGATLPDRGEIRILGRSTASIQDGAEWLSVVDRFGIVSERAVLLDAFSVLQNLSMPFTLDIDPPPDEVRAQSVALAQEVGLAESVWLRPVGELDAAGRLLVRLGRALALGPAILLLEHASAGLTREDAAALGTAIRGIAARRGIALLAATVDMAFASAVGRRVFALEPATGRLVERRAGILGRLFQS